MKEQFSLRIDSELLKVIKIMSIEDNKSISDTIQDLILESLIKKENLSLDSFEVFEDRNVN